VRIGSYGPGATQADRDTLYQAVTNIAGDCAAIIPEGMKIEFIESKSIGASAALYLDRTTISTSRCRRRCWARPRRRIR
jgi:phage gp29-like protein